MSTNDKKLNVKRRVDSALLEIMADPRCTPAQRLEAIDKIQKHFATRDEHSTPYAPRPQRSEYFKKYVATRKTKKSKKPTLAHLLDKIGDSATQ